MLAIVADLPDPTCFHLLFRKAESKNLNHLVLIPSRLARATLAGVLRRDTPATRVAGRAAFAILGGAYLISWPGR